MEVFYRGDRIEKNLDGLVSEAASADGREGKDLMSGEMSELAGFIRTKKDLIHTRAELSEICEQIDAIRTIWRDRIMEACSVSGRGEELVRKMNEMIDGEIKAVLGERIFIPEEVDQKVALAGLCKNIFDPSVDEASRHFVIEWCKFIVYSELTDEYYKISFANWTMNKLNGIVPGIKFIWAELDHYAAKCDRGGECSIKDLITGMSSHLKIEISYERLSNEAGLEAAYGRLLLSGIRKLQPRILGSMTEEKIVTSLLEEGSPFQIMGHDMQSIGHPNVAEPNGFVIETSWYIGYLLRALTKCGEINAIRSEENFNLFLKIVSETLIVMPYLGSEKSVKLPEKIKKIYQFLALSVQKIFGLKNLVNIGVDFINEEEKPDYSMHFMLRKFIGDDAVESIEENRILQLCHDLAAKYPGEDFTDLSKFGEFNDFALEMDNKLGCGMGLVSAARLQERVRRMMKKAYLTQSKEAERKLVADILGSLGDSPVNHDLEKIQETVIQTGAQLLILAWDLHASEAVLLADERKNAGDDLLKLADSVSSGATTVEIPEEIKNYLSLLSELKVKICRYNAALAEIFSAEPSAGQNKKIAALIKEENELAASLDRLLAEGRENYTAEIARLRTDSQKELHHLKDVMKEQEERFKKLIGEIGDLEKEYNHYLDE